MFISTKLTTEGRPQISTALPIKAAAFPVKPFLGETLLSPLCLLQQRQGEMHSYFEKQQVTTSFQGMKPNQTFFFFSPSRLPKKMKKKKERKKVAELYLSATLSLAFLAEMSSLASSR